MANIINIQKWADAYSLQECVKVFQDNGFDSLVAISNITESDVDSMGYSKIGTKKKILLAVERLREKGKTMINSGSSSLSDLNTAYTKEEAKPSHARLFDISDGVPGKFKKMDICMEYYPNSNSENVVGIRAVALKAAMWDQNSTITVKFLNGVVQQHNKVMQVAKQWEQYCNLTLQLVSNQNAQVRVNFRNDNTNYSSVGKFALQDKDQSHPTMELSNQIFSDDNIMQRKVLHEFGHVLGLIHEHQNPIENPLIFNVDVVKEIYGGSPNYWSDKIINENILKQNEPGTLQFNGTAFDKDSIMLYPFPSEILEDPIPSWNTTKLNSTLSSTDKRTIGLYYPKSTSM